MIVKCEQCQTRFKIPDDKVTDKGVRVRCTKCQHTFRVTRDMAQPATGPVATKAPTGPIAVKQATGPIPTKSQTGPIPAPMPSPSGPRSDPFARFELPDDDAEKTRAGIFTAGIEASRMPDLIAAPAAPMAPARPPPSVASTPFDFGSLTPNQPTASPPTRQPGGGAAFDFGGLLPSSSPPSQPAGQAPFDFSSLGPPPGAAAPRGNAPASSGTLSFELAPPFPVAGNAPAPAPAAPMMSTAPPAAFDFSSLGAPPAGPSPAPSMGLGAPPPSAFGSPAPAAAQAASAPSVADLFADLPPPDSDPNLAPVPESTEGRFGAEVVEMPPASTNSVDVIPMPQASSGRVAVARLQLAKRPAELIDRPAAAANEAAAAAAAAAESSGRGILGLVGNVAIALALVLVLLLVGAVVANEGKVDMNALTLRTLFPANSDFVASDISNGLYDTVRGKPVFFVRGEVTNKSTSSTRVRIRAEILDGESLVRSAEVVAGAPPTPEDLHRLAGADDVKQLLEERSKAAPAVPPGESVPFLVTFFEYPPDLKAFRVRVSAKAEPLGETAAR